MRAAVLFLLTATFAAVICLTQLSGYSSEPATSPAIAYTIADRYEPLAWLRGGERFPAGSQIYIREADNAKLLIKDFFATTDPNVSFDGNSVLFAGKKTANDPWQIWETGIDGDNLRRIVTSREDAVRPMYMPEAKLVYAAKRNGRFVIEIASLEGGKPLPLLYEPGNSMIADVLRDGRILFQAPYPLGTNGAPELYSVYSDGSGVESYRCDHSTRARYAGRQVSTGDIVFTHGSSLARFSSALKEEIALSMPAGDYAGDVVETNDGWLLPWRASPQAKFELKSWTENTHAFQTIVKEAGKNAVQPVVVMARQTPPRFPSALLDRKDAELMSLNVYASPYNFAPGTIAKVNVYSADVSGRPRILGTAPVEADGSFFVKVPADQPLKFEVIDRSGRTLKREAGWMWVRAGEQRICVGCHAGPERAPENNVPMALTRSTEPVNLTGKTSLAQSGGH